MSIFIDKLPVIIKWFLAYFVAMYAGLPNAIRLLLLLMAVDIVTGVFASIKESNPILSKKLRDGLITKAVTLIFVFIAHPMEQFVSMETGVMLEVSLEKWLAIGFIFGELLSIIENVYRAGVKLPAKLIEYIIRAKSSIKLADTQQMKILFSSSKDSKDKS